MIKLLILFFLIFLKNNIVVGSDNLRSLLKEEGKLHNLTCSVSNYDDTLSTNMNKDNFNKYLLEIKGNVLGFSNELINDAIKAIKRRLEMDEYATYIPWEELSANVFAKIRNKATILPLADAFALGYIRNIEGWAHVFDLLYEEMLSKNMMELNIKTL